MQCHVPFKFITSTAFAVILVDRPVARSKPGIVIFTEQAETITDGAQRPTCEIRTKAESADIASNCKRPAIGKVDESPGSDEGVEPVFVAGSIPDSWPFTVTSPFRATIHR